MITPELAVGAHGFDGISGKEYRAIYRNLECSFGWDADAGYLSTAVRNAIREAIGFPPLWKTIGEMNQAQRAVKERAEAIWTPPLAAERPILSTERKIQRPTPRPPQRCVSFIAKKYRSRYFHWTMKEFVYRRDEGRCFYCHCDVAEDGCHYDHVLPVSRGGKSTYTNLVLSCPKCNLSKHASVLENLDEILAEVKRRNREIFG